VKTRKGFTLIELLVVLAIIGVLMGIGIPIYTGQLKRAKARAIAANLKLISQTIANTIMMGEDINNGAMSADDLKKYVRGIDTGKYHVKVEDSGDASKVTSWYTGGDVTADDTEKDLTGCDATQTTVGGKTYPACAIGGIKPMF
jgi:prepilin-type N-terminal cleavage/methylation domain-containing protein